ncbi:28643_t:CDS:2 [Dentiscutata erythropus]|uniref:28643_t:CDS:1 n=1 Tax=Dentiscutata erythropus TaxID=1348616 RepID=A0A9N9FQ85_9GLOM|nr:28643_t:CDS:2 [Dentiscutata erythropus]
MQAAPEMADKRQRLEIIWSVKTLDQLQEALTNINYKLSCSAAYLRLIPRQNNSEEGKRHVKMVPVKLLRSQNSARRAHEDTHFCAALIKNVKEMVSVLGLKTVANKRVELPDHDWVVAKRHKLISSVYAILDIQEGKYGQAEAVTYSGPTFIRIRSGKHDSNTAYSHNKDFDNLMNEEKLHNYTTTMDEQPACFAPYQSSSNLVEMRIAPLSHNLASVILLYDIFGSHLDAQLRTNNKKLEKRNFKAAADILTSI